MGKIILEMANEISFKAQKIRWKTLYLGLYEGFTNFP